MLINSNWQLATGSWILRVYDPGKKGRHSGLKKIQEHQNGHDLPFSFYMVSYTPFSVCAELKAESCKRSITQFLLIKPIEYLIFTNEYEIL